MRLTTIFAAALAISLSLGIAAGMGNETSAATTVAPIQAGQNDHETQQVEMQLTGLSTIVAEARQYASTALGNPKFAADQFSQYLDQAHALAAPWPDLAAEASLMIAQAGEEAASLLKLRENLFAQYSEETIDGSVNPGTRIGWSLLRIASGGPETRLRRQDFSFDADSAEIRFTYLDVPFHIRIDSENEDAFRASAMDYTFVADWPVLLQKPVGWMAVLARQMRDAGIAPRMVREWEIMEGPGSPIAFAKDAATGARTNAFYEGKLLDVFAAPQRADTSGLVEDFLAAAEQLHKGITRDESIPRQIRQAMHPILEGAYKPVDPRDYFDSAFCRRLIEADYLESSIPSLSSERQAELHQFRTTLAKIEAGYDAMTMPLDGTRRLVAVVGAEAAFPNADTARRSHDQGGDVVEEDPHYEWRLENGTSTVFYSPLPERQMFGFMLAEQYEGVHSVRPRGVPTVTEIIHPVVGTLASYRNGADKAEGSPELWTKAVNMDARGGRSSQADKLAWGFPMHVLYRDDQGDPVLLATANGVVPSPDFFSIGNEAERRQAEDAWLDGAARVLGEPGELGLIFYHFFRYCSDSPMPEMPNLIGSHYGLSDTHQTVYESMERRWVGRLIGDCDDLAEFFQVLTRRQGKLSHVMSLPAHAAAGYAELTGDGEYRFVVLQTGPVMQFTASTLDGVVEKAYRAFDRDGSETQLTAAAVPLLLRFADEETRTPFVLSARIYGDAGYAEAMVRVQEYWHKHVFSAAIAEMERMVTDDRELGSIKELGSLYQRVHMFDRAAALREEELDASRGDMQATVSALLDLTVMHYQAKDKAAALDALGRVEEVMNGLVVREDTDAFNRLMSFRSYWAVLLAQLGEPEQAWNLIRLDVNTSKQVVGRLSESVLRTLVTLYDRMAQKRDAGGYAGATEQVEVMGQIEKEIDTALRSGFFRRDDAYNAVISRYALLGRHAVAKSGRGRGLAKLQEDGPYASVAKDQTKRGSGIQDEDWEWMRISPRLYLSYAMEMLDKDEHPQLYNPELAGVMLDLVDRAVDKGTGLGADISGSGESIRAALIRSFLNRDLAGFNRAMAVVRERDFSSLYDESALVFGSYCGLVPAEEFPAWIEAFHRFFPGRQHYFKVVYRALDKEFFRHAALLAKATAEYFPDDRLLVNEAEFASSWIPQLEKRAAERGQEVVVR